jgi:ankyrin repeat protein
MDSFVKRRFFTKEIMDSFNNNPLLKRVIQIVTPLQKSIIEKDITQFEKYIKEGYDVDEPAYEGITALLLACDLGREKEARILLENGADPNKHDNMMTTPLEVAFAKKYENIVDLLFEYTDWIYSKKEDKWYEMNNGPVLKRLTKSIFSGKITTYPKCCMICKTFSKVKRCGRCLKIFYCSIKHQQEDRKRHKSECNPKQCFMCGYTINPGRNIKKCSGCKGIYYCCEKHQKDDWKRHKKECKPLIKRKH